MKSTELRIGNWFKTFEIDQPRGEEYYQIESFSQNKEKALGVEFRNGSCWSIVDLIEPIPLTEEWLVKFNLTPEDLLLLRETIANFRCISEDDVILDYVHDFQNAWRVLTGEELTIKG